MYADLFLANQIMLMRLMHVNLLYLATVCMHIIIIMQSAE